MNNILYICQNLGLGDHIITNAIVRKLNKSLEKILFVRECNYESVKHMFCDRLDITLSLVQDEYNMMRDVQLKGIKNYITIGLHTLDQTEYFDRSFYKALGIDFAKRWTDFYVPRNKEREDQLFKKLNITENEKFIFLHEDVERKYIIKRKYIDENIRVIIPHRDITDNIFDYYTVLEKAAEIHLISSSFNFFVDSIETDNRIYLHDYARYEPCYRKPNLKRDWVIYNN